jgi:hypothetical protein
METDSGEGDPGLTSAQRRELERVAFSRPTTDSQRDAAARALRTLVEADEAAAIAAGPPPARAARVPVPVEAASKPIDAGADVYIPYEPVAESARKTPNWRRALVAVIVLIGLAVGTVIGFAAARSPLQSPFAGSTPTPAHSGVLFTQFVPGALSKSQAAGNLVDAINALGAARTSRDVFPVPGLSKTLGLRAESVHRVMTTADGETLWIARAEYNICLVYTSSGRSGATGYACATPSGFTKGGISLSSANDEWTWNGDSFTTTTGY